MNRNFGATRNQPGVVGMSCNDTTFRGPSALSAPESVALLDVFADANLPGSYVTRFALNVHAYGNFVLFPEGLDNPTKFCSTIGNCTAPDFGILEKLLGSEQNTVLRDPETARPFVVGTSFRNLYPVAGDGMHPTFYGEPNRPDVPKFLSASLEVTHTECTFQAEAIPAAQFDASFEQFKQLNVDALGVLPNIASSSFLDNLILPHLHRRAVTGDGKETPTIRLAARPSLGPVTFDWPGTTEVDDVRDGVNYRMWRFRPDDPYVFPTEVTVCVKGQCSTTTSPGEEKIDLCTPRFSGDSPWSFVGPDPSLSPDECYWHFDDSQVGQITSPTWSLADMYGAHLVFSHRNWSSLGSSTNIRVLVSNNGFQNCKPEPGTGCRIVREFPYGDSNFDVRSQFGFAGAYRTEILDISEYDHVDKMEVRFEVTKTGSKIDVFDAIVIGWKG